MDTLLLKLIVTPVLIGAASIAGRRWGETVSGWFIGLPLTSGPVCWFLALEQGTGFAAAAARGCLAGAAAEAGFCVAYGVTARKAGWIRSLAAGRSPLPPARQCCRPPPRPCGCSQSSFMRPSPRR
jgi:hypothetical protein